MASAGGFVSCWDINGEPLRLYQDLMFRHDYLQFYSPLDYTNDDYSSLLLGTLGQWIGKLGVSMWNMSSLCRLKRSFDINDTIRSFVRQRLRVTGGGEGAADVKNHIEYLCTYIQTSCFNETDTLKKSTATAIDVNDRTCGCETVSDIDSVSLLNGVSCVYVGQMCLERARQSDNCYQHLVTFWQVLVWEVTRHQQEYDSIFAMFWELYTHKYVEPHITAKVMTRVYPDYELLRTVILQNVTSVTELVQETETNGTNCRKNSLFDDFMSTTAEKDGYTKKKNFRQYVHRGFKKFKRKLTAHLTK